jgi:hypothetical protein
MAIIGSLVDKQRASKQVNPPTSAQASASSTAADAPKPSGSTADRANESATSLSEAKKALLDGYKPSKDPMKTNWGRVRVARENLEAIQVSDKEYAEAQRLLHEVQRRETEIERTSKIAARILLAAQAERNYLDKGMDVSLTLSGPEKKIIKFKYVLMSRPMVHQLTNDEGFMSTLRGAGFKSIIFTDGYFNTWTQELE